MRYFNDYSFLFNTSNSSSGSGMSNLYSMLSEYNNIRSGTYAKVVKKYYAKAEESKDASTDKTTEKDKNKTNKKLQTVSEEEKALNQVQADAQSLSKSADVLITRGTDSLFREKDMTVKAEDGTETTKRGYDTDAIYKAVKKFADGYNSLMTSMGETKTDSVSSQVSRMANLTKTYEKQLSDVGIEISSDHKLTVNEEKLKSADVSTLKTLFNGNTSYAYNVATKASMINVSAKSAADSTKLYTSSGSYNNSWSTGSLLDSFF